MRLPPLNKNFSVKLTVKRTYLQGLQQMYAEKYEQSSSNGPEREDTGFAREANFS